MTDDARHVPEVARALDRLADGGAPGSEPRGGDEPQGTFLRDGDLRLRPLRLPEDVSLALPWYRDPEVMWLSEGDGSARYDANTILSMYRYLLARGEVFIIEIQKPREWVAVGDAALCPNLIPIVIGDANYRSQGLGSRVLRLLIARARELGWRRIGVSGVYTYNPRARQLFESAGFRVTAVRSERGQPETWTLELHLSPQP